jgi:hypothetical protein
MKLEATMRTKWGTAATECGTYVTMTTFLLRIHSKWTCVGVMPRFLAIPSTTLVAGPLGNWVIGLHAHRKLFGRSDKTKEEL